MYIILQINLYQVNWNSKYFQYHTEPESDCKTYNFLYIIFKNILNKFYLNSYFLNILKYIFL